MAKLRVTRSVQIPDLLRLHRYRKAPELGPRILFFSGGTALNGLCQSLKKYTHNSIHLVTPFDSGGSSATLRRAFQMPAIGDVRSRLMALADDTVLGHPEVFQLFNHRFPMDQPQATLLQNLSDLAAGKSSLIADINNPMRQLIRHQLGYFMDAMPDDFDLRGASIGNLILAGGYLNNHNHMDPIVFLFSKLVSVQGTVRVVVNKNLHLGAHLEDGSCILEQHRLTGKEVNPIHSPIKQLFLSQSATDVLPAEVSLRKKNRKLIESADLICFPPGSFYSSLMANLLPNGVGSAIHQNCCPKVFIPNLGTDPEQLGMNFFHMLNSLLDQLKLDLHKPSENNELIGYVLIDRKNGQYPFALPDDKAMEALGITVINTRLISQASAPYYDNELLVAALLSLC